MRINGRNRLACKTLIRTSTSKKPVIIEAIKGLPLEKDLVVDMEPFFDAYRDVMPFLIPEGHEPTRERLQSAEDRAIFDDTTKCILCACCTARARCSGATASISAPLPSSGAPLHLRFTRCWYRPAPGHPQQQRGVWRCRTTFNCTEACPRGIEVTKAIAEVKRALMFRRRIVHRRPGLAKSSGTIV